MRARLRSGWQKIKQHLVAILISAIILAVAIGLIIVGYRFDWTGFNGNNKSGKTLWDWLQLLIIPSVLAGGGIWLNQIQKDREQKTTEQRAQTEREAAEKHAQAERDIARDNQQEVTLQEYINKMSELLLEEDLRKSDMDAEVRTIARVRTLTVLRRLNGERKGNVLRFLCESGLIIKGKSVINLDGADFEYTELAEADLSCADLRGAIFFRAELYNVNLENADLTGIYFTEAYMNCTNLGRADLTDARLARTDLAGTNLSEANLSGAILEGAILSNEVRAYEMKDGKSIPIKYGQTTNLKGAKVTQEQLDQASTLEGAIIPDGSIHP